MSDSLTLPDTPTTNEMLERFRARAGELDRANAYRRKAFPARGDRDVTDGPRGNRSP